MTKIGQGRLGNLGVIIVSGYNAKDNSLTENGQLVTVFGQQNRRLARVSSAETTEYLGEIVFYVGM